MRHAFTLGTALAALVMFAPGAMAQGTSTQAGKFCLKGPGSAQECKYDTMASCEKAKKSGQQCAANTGTTGTGSTTSPSNMKK